MVIHGLLVTWFFRSLALIFDCLKMVCRCVCFWKCFGRRCLVLGNQCIWLVFECFTKVCIFSKRCFKCFWEFVWKCCGWWFLKRRQVFLQVWSQVTKSFVYPIVLKGFCYVLTFLTILFHHWIWWTILRLGSLFGTGAGHRMDHECNDAKCLWQFALKGLWSFRLGNTLRFMIIWFCFAKDTRRASMAHFGRQHVGLP